jgi:pimeloyl-ACP methyl ester carboxylesterase
MMLASCATTSHTSNHRAGAASVHETVDALRNSGTAAAVADYNASLDELLVSLLRRYPSNELHGTLDFEGRKIVIDPGTSELLQIDPRQFDEVDIIRKPEGGDQVSNMVTRGGIGIPVVMRQNWRKEKASGKKLFPLNGRHLPATCVADVDRSGKLVLRFHHTRNVQQAVVGGRMRDLAYDMSTPLHRSMGGRFGGHMALRGLLNSDRYLDDTGIYLPDVYDPAKIPVVFVHGLKSDPNIWQNAMNEVLRDPELRKKYQCWYFLYPTGLPVYASAAKLRRMLHLARDHYDPQHNNPQMNRMVLVGHSMGGLLSRMQTVDSKDEIYKAHFVKPLEQMPLQLHTKQLIEDAMLFKRLPFVKRTVFVASPHQGSSVAQIPIVRAVGLLVNPTSNLDSVTMDIRLNARDGLNPELNRFRNMGCRSVQTLSPDHPILNSLQRLPMQVPCHSIIARTKADGPLEQTSDGVVAYWSSHVPQAKSEKVLQGNHGCARLPEAAEEIKRILRLHLKAP